MTQWSAKANEQRSFGKNEVQLETETMTKTKQTIEQIDSTTKILLDTLDKKKHDQNFQKMKYVRGMLICRKYMEMGERINKNLTYKKIYYSVTRLRKALSIEGKGCELIPRHLVNTLTFAPICLFEKETKEERVKKLDFMLKNIEKEHFFDRFEKLVRPE